VLLWWDNLRDDIRSRWRERDVFIVRDVRGVNNVNGLLQMLADCVIVLVLKDDCF